MPHIAVTSTPLQSEDAILGHIALHFPNTGKDVLLGRGDDCAVLKSESPLCVSTDLFMEDVHFRRSYFLPQDIGWKALAVNLSDLAACGARPSGFTAGISLPSDADMELVDGLCEGMAHLAAQAQIPLVGGDLSRAERLHLCITVFGQTDTPLLRNTALPDDAVFLIGEIGLARTGLQLLEERGRSACSEFPVPCAAHLHPAPRLAEGMILASLAARWKAEKTSAARIGLMDLSDGLARDLPRLLGKRGANLSLPDPHPSIVQLMREQGKADPDQAARLQCLLGGEDYALIGTCPKDLLEKIQESMPETVLLGSVTDSGDILVDNCPLRGGFDHFG